MNNVTQASSFPNWIPNVLQNANRVSAPQEFLQGDFGGDVHKQDNVFVPPFTYTLKRDTLLQPIREKQIIKNAIVKKYLQNL